MSVKFQMRIGLPEQTTCAVNSFTTNDDPGQCKPGGEIYSGIISAGAKFCKEGCFLL